MDQHTATVITTSITAASTLLGAFGGIIINNYHAAKKEKLEKRTTAIEEAIETLLKVDKYLNTACYSAIDRIGPPTEVNSSVNINNIADYSLRIDVLVRLYMPDLKDLLRTYHKNVTDLCNEVMHCNITKHNSELFDEDVSKVKDRQDIYKTSLSAVLEKMEKMVV